MRAFLAQFIVFISKLLEFRMSQEAIIQLRVLLGKRRLGFLHCLLFAFRYFAFSSAFFKARFDPGVSLLN